MEQLLIVNILLVCIFIVVLVLPFKVRKIEENLEVFLFICGTAALTAASFAAVNGETFGWTTTIVLEALSAPIMITTVAGIPVGIVQIVLIMGLIIYFAHTQIKIAIQAIVDRIPLSVIVFFLICGLGIISSVISAILAAIILVEIVCALPLGRQEKIGVTVISCFSIGLGAALTPLGEPLSTIAVSKLIGDPYHAGFTFLFNLLGIYIIPGILALGVLGVVYLRRQGAGDEGLECNLVRESIRDVVIRAGKVYLFIMALVFLGEGFKPLILEYIIQIPSEGLYWVNIVSAVLDNATLAAAEIGPQLTLIQIKSALMGLLIAGGMLIPGNIPNIIAAGKMGITSKEWARYGLPLGFALMLVFFVILFVPAYLGIA
ncbi:MAG: cation transporter [Methanomicrobiales archaeon HGW-Methanomicrobiales-1]|jgi:predicted cation transporter|nr:MAG: cation transporter [Methanomicrobiales archaeon HGW-Methanomicrobiales-1]